MSTMEQHDRRGTRRSFTEEFKAEAVQLARSSPDSVLQQG